MKGQITLINLIKDGIHHLEIASELNFPEDGIKILEKLFRSAYECLINFCYNNPHNQVKLFELKEMFMLDTPYDLGKNELLCNIYKNNQELLEKVDLQTFNNFFNLIKSLGRRAGLLNFFETIQKLDESIVEKN